MADAWEILRLLADPTRVRILCLLSREELSVAELQEILDMGQSRISSHLGLLRQGVIVKDRREGKKTFYSTNPEMDPQTERVVDAARDAVEGTAQIREDLGHFERILDKRKQRAEQYFNSVAGRLGKNYCPGRSWDAIGHFLLHLTPRIRIADLGAGEGLLSQLLARRAEQVTCVDSSARMVEFGTDLAAKNGFSNLEYKLGDIEAVPLPAASVDLALFSQALHHARRPQVAVEEAYRILKPGGQIVVIDLLEHQFEQARELYADVWLGFSENKLFSFMKGAGFRKIEVNVVAREQEPPQFETVLAVGEKL